MNTAPHRLAALVAPLVFALLGQAGAQVVINEIMYHPPHADGVPEPTGEEFIELLNAGTGAVSLDGWELDRGVDYTFPAISLDPGETLVVAADLAAFQTSYPGVVNAVGDWSGRLSNSGEEIRLQDALGNTIDSVSYADQGDWATRVRERIGGEDGWAWDTAADGRGRSLELRNPALTNKSGQNWIPSSSDGGSAGAANPAASTDVAPLIRDVEHSPAVPRSTETVQIEADIVDETPGDEVVTLHWRSSKLDPQDDFAQVPMEDNNGNGRWEADLPALPNGTVVEFYIEASDGGNTRTWPAPTDQGQVANCLYQVDDETIAAPSAAYRLIMSVEEDDQFTDINRNSDAQTNTTLVADDGSGPSVRYLCGNRVRGAGSRGRDPVSHRINIPRDTPWNGVTRMNLNAQYTWLQFTGMKLFTASGLAAPETRRVQVRRNSVNFADGGVTNFGSYVHVEPLGGEFVDNHLPDNRGNLYKKVRPDVDWAWRDGDFGRYPNDGWSKSSNSAAADWSGLDEFLRVMNQADGDPDYIEQVEAVADLDQWMRWFAAMALLANGETNPSTGTDDDYSMYQGELDPRFIFVPHDLDTILGRGDGSAITETDSTLFDMIEPGANGRNDVLDPLVPLFSNAEIRTRYFEALRDLATTSFSKRRFDELVRNNLTGWVPSADIDGMITWMDGRRAFVLQEAENELGPAPPLTPPTTIATLFNDPGSNQKINEVLAVGTPDMIEVVNDELFPLNLEGFILEIDTPGAAPFVMPAGTAADGGGGVVSFTSDQLGFSLDSDGGTVTLKNAVGTVIDTLPYGLQIEGFSISRTGSNGRTWALTSPTLGSANGAPVALGDPATLRINEWLAQADYRFKRDYVELYNPDANPVALGGLAVTDDAINDPAAFTLPPLSYIAGDGYSVFHAVGNAAVVGEWDELPFGLSLDHEWVTVLGENGVLIDQVHFLQQRPDVAEGRTPDGGESYGRFGLATPDLANPNQSVQTTELVPWDGFWAYDDTDTDLGTAWRSLGFDDAAWPVGQAALGVEDAGIPVPIRTALAFQPPATHYFRNVFTFDGSVAASTTELELLVDDGTVAYLNGVEVRKLRLPAQVTHDTFAEGFIGEAAVEGPFAIPDGLLQNGSNVLAVEVHQSNEDSSDVVFAARLTATENLQNDPEYLAASTILNSLRVTEIMYNPAGSVDATEEFVEFQNIGSEPIDLEGVRITEGIEFVFPAMTLAPGEFVLVVAVLLGFAARYGDVGTVAGAFTGRLDNGGETLRVQLAQPFANNILCFAYDDDWFEGATDGDGLSLTMADVNGPIGLWDKRSGWLPGAVAGGTPGATGPAVITSPLIASGVQGAPFVYQITAANSPDSFGATGLPAGFTIDPSTGTIFGTSASSGLVGITISATNINGTESETLAITFAPQPPPQVNSALAVDTPLLAPLAYQITGTNNPTSFTASGLPSWLSFDPGTGLLSGAAPVPGEFSMTIGAQNLTGGDSETLVITVVTEPLAIAVDSQGLSWRTGGNNPWFAQTVESNDGVDAAQAGPSGDNDDDWIETTVNGPDTLTFWWMIINPGGFQRTRLTVLLDGNEQDRHTAGGFGGGNAPWEQVTVQIPNGQHVVRWNMNTRGNGGPGFLDQVRLASQANLPQITSPALANGIVGQPFSFALAATNSPTSFTATSLPDGLAADASGLISGAPTAVGDYVVNVAATNAIGTWVDTLTIRVGVPLPQALDTPGREWATGGDTPWFTIGAGAHDGVDAAQSGAIGDSAESWVATELIGPGMLTFWWDVSSQGGSDLFRFELDGSQQFAISGQPGWAQRTVNIPAGTHQARWRFTRNANGGGGEDAAWLDEVVYTTPDSDGDGLADAWEIEHFGDLSQGGDDDFDGDGANNADEFAALTDPTDPEDLLRIVEVTDFSGNSAELTWTSVPGQRYVVQGSTRLGTWNDLSSPIEADGALTTALAPAPGGFTESVTLVGEDDPARALVPLSDIGDLWRGGDEAAFAAAGGDGAWRTGPSGTGFEGGGGDYANFFGIDVRDLMEDQRTSVYLRVPFSFESANTVTSLTLRMRYDDGFAAFLNGVPIASANAPGNLDWQSFATDAHADQDATTFGDTDVTFAIGALQSGSNILAVHGMNDEATSSDALIEPVLEAEVSLFVDSTRGFWRVIAVGP